MTKYSAKKLLSKLKARGIVEHDCGRVIIDIDADSDWVQLLIGSPGLSGKLGAQLPELLSRVDVDAKAKQAKQDKKVKESEAAKAAEAAKKAKESEAKKPERHPLARKG